MSLSDNESRISILAKKVSDFVGRSSGVGYFNMLISAINTYLDLSYGFVYSVDYNSEDCYTLIAHSMEYNTNYKEKAIIEPTIIDRILNGDKHSIISDLDSYDSVNPLKLQSLVSFPLYDSDDNINGLIVFATTNVLIDEKIVIDTIETQIPRVASELEIWQIKKRLKITESSYSNFIDSTLDVIWEADISGHITAINRSCKAMYGYTETNMIGKCYTEYMTDASAIIFSAKLALSEQGESVDNVISDHLSNNNEVIRVCYNIIPKCDVNNNVIGVIGTTRDISASVRAQETIKNNSELFSSILSRLPVIFFRVDENGFLIDIRGNGLKRMGVEDMDWVDKPGYGLFLGMDAKIDSALSGNTVFFVNKGTYKGAPWWFYTSMFYDSWSGFGAVGFSVDITEQKYVEEQLVELLNNNRKLAQQLVEVQEDERRNLARELHDELGQSITAVKSLATAITTSVGNQYTEIRSLSNSIIDLSGRLYEVVNNIMQRLRPDIIDSLDFNETIKNCIVRSQLETIGVNCELKIYGNINDLEEVVKVTIYRIVQECLTNISKHAMASNVTIHIQRGIEDANLRRMKSYDSVQRDKVNMHSVNRDTIKIEIGDDGIGMNVNKEMHASEHAKRHGLQGINERVTAMGGTLVISGELGKGVNIQAVLVLGGINHDVSHDINKCISDLKKMRVVQPESKQIRKL